MTTTHACELPTHHPDYRTEDYCRGCNVARKNQIVTEMETSARHHASSVEFCTIIGCEVCE